MQWLRRISQGLFLLLFFFLFLQTESKGEDELGYPVKIFLDFDPLIFLSTLLSSKSLVGLFYLSLITILVTIIFGRVFCGWICPFGTLNNMVSSFKKSNSNRSLRNLHRLKYYILIFLVTGSLFGIQLTGLLDPISLIIRSFSISIYPAFNYVVRSFFDALYNLDIKGLSQISEFIYSLLKKTLLSFEQPFFRQGFFIGSIFLFILSLNLVEKRFWCKYLCPLGAFLGLLSKFSFLNRSVSEGCISCNTCVRECQGGSIKSPKEWEKSECLYCFNCDDLCPEKVVRFKFFKEQYPSIDLKRRTLITTISTAVISVPLIKINPFSKSEYLNPYLIRPPGALEESEFLKRCVRCGECMKVCITNGIQPAFLEGGIEALWTPIVVPKIGYCEFRCTLCGQVCPTGAIKRLSLQEKVKTKIGLATIDKNRCLPYAHQRPCIVCEEVCPTHKKAIWFNTVRVKDKQGKDITLQQPHVDIELCIGCGICESKCPVVDKPAIYVTNIGETRSKVNQLLLESY